MMRRLKVTLILVGVLVLALSGPAKAGVREKAVAILKNEQGRVLYNPVTKISIEAVSWVRYVYVPAEYILLGGYDFTLSLLSGGPGAVLKDFGVDALVGLGAEILKHPAGSARKAAKAGYDVGLNAYRDNYRMAQAYEKTGTLSEGDALAFMLNWKLQGIMVAAKGLYNDITAYERKMGASRKDPEAVYEQVNRDISRLAQVSGSTPLQKLDLWRKIWIVVKESHEGLPNYPPYQKYQSEVSSVLAATQNVLRAHQQEQEIHPVVIPASAPTPAPAPPFHKKIGIKFINPWTDTGITIFPGDHISVNVLNYRRVAGSAPRVGPEGSEDPLTCSFVCDQAAPYALVGNIAGSDPNQILDGKGFTVGSRFEGTAPFSNSSAPSGRLFLGFNDNRVKCELGRRVGFYRWAIGGNNRRFVTAKITVTRGRGN